jgi:hypothetical protein
MSSGLTFDLSIDPDARFVSAVRRFVEMAVERLLPESDAVFRVAMTAHELLENASKYCATGSVLMRFSARIEGEQALINLSIINDTTPTHIERLRVRIDAICAAPDPFAYYQRLMRDNAQVAGESGLGLARIAAEAEMMLGLEVKASKVAIMASTRAAAPARW